MRGLVTEEGNLAVVDFGRSTEPEMNKGQLAVALHRSTRWIEQQVRAGMPSRMDGNRRIFSLAACKSWLAENGRSVA